MMFYLNVPDAPIPTDSSVEVLDLPQKAFYVRVFKSQEKPSPARYQQELQILKNAIGSDTLYNTTVSYTAGYHSPWYSGERHNEVWLEKL